MSQTDRVDRVDDESDVWPPKGLSPRQCAFVDQYFLCNMNATKAAIAAGYAEGPSARVRGCRLLKDERIRGEINRRLEAEHMDAMELLRLIARDARGLFGGYILEEGKLDLEAMKEDGVLSLIDQVVPTKYGTSYKGPSRQRAQEMLVKILGLQTTQHVLSGEVKIVGSLDDRLQQVADLLAGTGTSKAAPEQD